MLSEIKKIRLHSVTKNATALFTLQFFNMVVPLLVIPYLSRVLGVESFGLLMFVFSLTAIGLVVTDAGFNLSATHLISKERNNIRYVSELIGAIFIIKLVLMMTLLGCAVFYVQFVDFSLSSYSLVFYIGLNILFQTFIPTWFFQGIEEMKRITTYMVIAKVVYMVLVFSCIKGKEDLDIIVFISALSNLFALSIAAYSIYSYGYSIKWPRKVSIIDAWKKSSQFFLSRIAVSIYTSMSTFLIGSFAGLSQAAIYAAGEKIYQASQSVTSPIAHALFPYMAKTKDSEILSKILCFIGIPLTIGCVVVGFWGHEVMSFVFGREFYQSGDLLQLFMLITVINFIGVNFGYPAFAGIGKVHIANYTVMFGALVQLTCLLIMYLTNSFSAVNLVIGVLITESIVMLSRIFIYRRCT